MEEAVEALYDEELAYARQMAEENPKNYQVGRWEVDG